MLKLKSQKELDFKEVCDDLDLQHHKYISGDLKTYTGNEIIENFLKRKNTFLSK